MLVPLLLAACVVDTGQAPTTTSLPDPAHQQGEESPEALSNTITNLGLQCPLLADGLLFVGTQIVSDNSVIPVGKDGFASWDYFMDDGVKIVFNGQIWLGDWYFNLANWEMNSQGLVDLLRHEARHAVLGQTDEEISDTGCG